MKPDRREVLPEVFVFEFCSGVVSVIMSSWRSDLSVDMGAAWLI